MSDGAACAAYLRSLIERADRAEIGSAQKAMIEHAITLPNPSARVLAMDDLLTELTGWKAGTYLSPLQDAFATVAISMIERTRLMVGPQVGSS